MNSLNTGDWGHFHGHPHIMHQAPVYIYISQGGVHFASMVVVRTSFEESAQNISSLSGNLCNHWANWESENEISSVPPELEKGISIWVRHANFFAFSCCIAVLEHKSINTLAGMWSLMLSDICILSGFLRTSTALFVAFVSGTTSFSEKIRLNRHCMFGEGVDSCPD